MRKYFIAVVVGIIILSVTFINLSPEQSNQGRLPPLTVYCETEILAEVLQPFIVNEVTTKYLSIKVTEVRSYTGKALVEEGEILDLYVSVTEELGCKDLNNDGAITIPDECENIGVPEKIYANSTVIKLKSGDIIKALIRCLDLSDDKCSFWQTDDSQIEVQ